VNGYLYARGGELAAGIPSCQRPSGSINASLLYLMPTGDEQGPMFTRKFAMLGRADRLPPQQF
jgi:hypothetical protein